MASDASPRLGALRLGSFGSQKLFIFVTTREYARSKVGYPPLMAHPELLEIIGVCEEMLARQDRLIARFKKEGRDTSDAIWLRRQITDLLDSIEDGIRVFEAGRLN